MHAPSLLTVRDLTVAFDDGPPVLDGITLSVSPGEALGVVGESGSGKTLLTLAVAGLLPERAEVVRGEIRLAGRDLFEMDARERRSLAGREIGIVFQEPRAALHPAWPVGWQVAEAVRRTGTTRREAREASVRLLDRMGIPDAARRAKDYAHQFSGGMCQRAALAMALAQDPALLLADEPTTALDVTVQAEILALLDELREERGLAVLLVSHDLSVVAGNVSRVLVLYAGRAMEEADVVPLFGRPSHPYTRGLLGSLPGGGRKRLRPIRGTVPGPGEVPEGCVFEPRCDIAVSVCGRERPVLREVEGGVWCACHRAGEDADG